MRSQDLSDGKRGVVSARPSGQAQAQFFSKAVGHVPGCPGIAEAVLGIEQKNPPEDAAANRCHRFSKNHECQ